MLKIGVQALGTVSENGLRTGISRIKNASFDCIDYNLEVHLSAQEIRAGKPSIFFDQSLEELKIYFSEHKKILSEYDLAISQMHAPFPVYEYWWKDEEKEQMSNYMLEVTKKSIAICSYLNCRYLVVHPFTIRYELGDEKERTLNIKFFSKLIPYAKKHNVVICLENLFYGKNGRIIEGICSSGEEAVSYIDELNRIAGQECFGFCFDVGHANILGKDMFHMLCTLNNRLKILHIHDNDAVYDLHMMPYSYTKGYNYCSTDWDGFLSGLKAIEYDGVISFETFRCMNNYPKFIQNQILSMIYHLGRYFISRINLKQFVGKRNLVLFGAGNMFENYMKIYGEQCRPEFVVDNDSMKWDTMKNGIEIKNPRELLKIEPDNCVIVICNIYYDVIANQLVEMGIEEFYQYNEELGGLY